MYCTKCGTENMYGARLCVNCGREMHANGYEQTRQADVNEEARESFSSKLFGFVAGNMTETEYVAYKEKLRKVIVRMIIGVVIGIVMVSAMGETGLAVKIIVPLMMAGVPYVWCMIPFYALGLISLFVKIVVSVLLGWIIAPIALTINLVRVISYRKTYLQ